MIPVTAFARCLKSANKREMHITAVHYVGWGNTIGAMTLYRYVVDRPTSCIHMDQHMQASAHTYIHVHTYTKVHTHAR